MLCANDRRDRSQLCVVETPADVQALEQSTGFRGLYFVLMGHLSPLDGIGPEDLKISELLARIEKEEFREIILATNPSTEGEATSSYISKLLSAKGLKVTRIAFGVPMGGDLKYMDALTLQHSLKSRTPLVP